MQNLGKLLADAGIKGGKSHLTAEQARAMSKKQFEEVHAHEAMSYLSNNENFRPLFDVDKGEQFMYELQHLLRLVVDGVLRIPFSEHTVYAIVQLAHYHRDRLSGSKRKSFTRIIPPLMGVKAHIEKRMPNNLPQFFLQKITPPEPAPDGSYYLPLKDVL